MSAGDWVAAFLAVAAAFAAGWALRRPPQPEEIASAQPQPAPSDSRFDDLLAALDVGAVVLDARGNVTAFNRAAAAMFDLTGKAVLGRALIEVVPSFELDRRARDALGGKASRGDVAMPAGHRAHNFSVVAAPLRDGAGALLIATDETRLRELERARRDFVSNVSHELRTPLSSINLMLETVLTPGAESEAYDLFLPRIKVETDRLIELVEHLLELARAEGRRLPVRRGDVDFRELVCEIVETFEARAAQASVRLRFRGEPARLSGDRDRLAQVVVNLLENALRHTPAGGSVDVEVEAASGSVTLRVRDTGEGIPYGDVPYVFERFYVVDRSRARESSGIGVGLAIVRHIVEAHGGSVAVESELGVGSVFTCVFSAGPHSRPEI